MAAGLAPGQSGSLLGRTETAVECYGIHTPGQGSGRTSPTVSSPCKFLEQPQAAALWMEEAATHTEDSVEEGERLAALVERLRSVDGVDSKSVEFVLRVSQLIPEYKSLYGT